MPPSNLLRFLCSMGLLHVDPKENRVFQLCKQSAGRMHLFKQECNDAWVEPEMCWCYEIIYARVPTE